MKILTTQRLDGDSLSDAASKQANKNISECIQYFYVTKTGKKPDATHYKSDRKMIERLLLPSEEYRTYTADDLKATIDFLVSSNIALTTMTILMWPDLVRCVADKDMQSQKIISRNIKSAQIRDGIMSDKEIKDAPKGW